MAHKAQIDLSLPISPVTLLAPQSHTHSSHKYLQAFLQYAVLLAQLHYLPWFNCCHTYIAEPKSCYLLSEILS